MKCKIRSCRSDAKINRTYLLDWTTWRTFFRNEIIKFKKVSISNFAELAVGISGVEIVYFVPALAILFHFISFQFIHSFIQLRYARSGRSGALRAPPLPSLASLRLSREPYTTALQFA